MSMPFYVAPEQVMKDRADYARKGIARGRSVVVVQFADGVLLVTAANDCYWRRRLDRVLPGEAGMQVAPEQAAFLTLLTRVIADLALALKGVNAAVRGKITKNLSGRAAREAMKEVARN